MTFRPAAALFAVIALLGTSARADVFLVPDATADVIVRVNGAGVKSNVVTTGLSTPEQAVVDLSGNIFVADSGAGKVFQYPAAGGGPIQVGDAVAGITALGFSDAGVLHVAIGTDRTIRKLDGGMFQVLATLATGAMPRGFAFAADGNIFVADEAGNRVFEVTPAGGSSVFSDDVIAPYAMAFDATGKLHAIDTAKGGRIVTFNPNGKTRDVITGLGSVRGLGFDRANTAHFLTGSGELRKVTGNTTALVASGLGDARLLTVRSPVTRIAAFKGQTLVDPAGAVFSTVNSPAIGGGFVAFKATLLPGVAGVGSSNSSGIWRGDSTGTLTLLARKSFPPPGLPSNAFSLVGDPVINNAGKVAFIGTMIAGVGDATAANSKAVFTDASGTFGPVLRKGSPAPGPGLDPNVKFTNFKQLVLPDDAGPAVLATIAGPGVTTTNNLGLWSVDATGTAELVVRKGDMIMVGGKLRRLSSLGLFTSTPLSRGQGRHAALGRKFTFLAKFSDGFAAVLLVQPGSAPMVLAEKNGLVGATLPGAQFSGFGPPCVSDDASEFAFLGKLAPNLGGVTTASAAAVFTQSGGANTLQVQKAFPAPDVVGAVFSTITDPVMSPSGAFAFSGKMRAGLGGVLTSTAGGLWADLGSGLDLAIRQGDAAPGISGTVKFTAFKQFVLPDTGGVVYVATVSGTGITTANNLGVWADDGAGASELLLRKGDKITIDGRVRTVTSITIFKTIAGLTGQSRHFDAAGNVACLIACSDGMRAILTFHRP